MLNTLVRQLTNKTIEKINFCQSQYLQKFLQNVHQRGFFGSDACYHGSASVSWGHASFRFRRWLQVPDFALSGKNISAQNQAETETVVRNPTLPNSE